MNSLPLRTDNGTILIVDDKPDNLRLLSIVLMEHAYEVKQAINGSIALMGAKAAPPDLILLDVSMPEMDGYEVCQQLKQSDRTRDIPIIFLSALDDTLNKVKAFEVGGVDYITKPFHMQEVLARVENQLTIQRQKQQLHRQMEQERIVGAIAQRVRQSLDLNVILETTVSEIQAFFQADRVILCRFVDRELIRLVTEAASPMVPTLGVGNDWSQLFEEADLERFCQGSIEILDSRNLEKVTPAHAAIIQELGIKSKMIAPILHQHQVWGFISIHSYFEFRQWSEQDVRVLQQLATQVGIAIQQAELYQQVQQSNMNLEQQVAQRTQQLQLAYDFESTLKRIIERVRDSLDEAKIMQAAVKELAIALDMASCNASIYNLERRTSTICFEYTTLDYSFQGHVSQMESYPEIYSQLLKRQVVQLCSRTPNPLQGSMAMLAHPIFDDQGALGDIWLINHCNYAFTERDIQLVEQVACQCAIALRQSRLYRAVQAQVNELEQLNQLKDDFLNTVSHELRTPMANIKMATQMLELLVERATMVGEDSVAFSQYLKMLTDAHQQEMKLIDTLLDLSRLDAETDPLVISTIELQIWLPYLAEPFLERARSQTQQWEITVQPDLPPLTTDLLYLERILMELMQNACKYTPPNQTIRLEAHRIRSPLPLLDAINREVNNEPTPYAVETGDRDWVQINVINTGVEIPESEWERVFDKFYRIPNNDPWKYGGTGLGLALVKKLAHRLGATIAVSSLSQQTIFTLRLPITPTGFISSRAEFGE
ncbi:hybrid sensor histidine kinase/response regulator [Leptolyngbya sp. AN02str]|uniref:hybrid sensor histidine kinase/response regulator n=1 Tax=Leptolyngbya sp. AN02str TaxID=3423363 RepID=UPI003D31D273